MPALRTRLFFYQLWRSRLKGALCWWSISYWKKNPWDGGKPNSGILIYPPRSEGEHGPVSSIRWEMALQGLEDYEYLTMLERLIAEAKQRGDQRLTEAIPKGERALSRVGEITWRFPRVQPPNDQPYTLDVRKVEDVRNEVAEAIECLLKEKEQR